MNQYDAKATHRVFVYGSLLSGLHNHRCLDGATFVGTARTTGGGWRMLDLHAFPALVPDANGGDVVGEVYDVDGPGLAVLDRLEGFPRFYNRRQIGVAIGADRTTAWVYHMQDARVGCPTVEGRDWRAYLLTRDGAEADLGDDDEDFPE
jgi:gamma-glutamylcyclotransferase (GGCT)/AIG2-like uncharacterized protein YtfP